MNTVELIFKETTAMRDHLSPRTIFLAKGHTVEPVLKDHPRGHTNVVSEDGVFGGRFNSIEIYTCQEYLVFQDRWSFMAVVSQDRFHCT